MTTALREYYDSSSAPHEALGRAARTVDRGGAIYLGDGIGVEKQGDSYAVTKGGETQKVHKGPLSATTHAFTLAGASMASDTPGGMRSVSDPAAAARIRELDGMISDMRERLRGYRAEQSRSGLGGMVNADRYTIEATARCERNLSAYRSERRRLLAGANVQQDVAEQRRAIAALAPDALEAVQRAVGFCASMDGDERLGEALGVPSPAASFVVAEGEAENGEERWALLAGELFRQRAVLAAAGLGPMPWGSALSESAKTAALSVTHAPIGKGGTNWITRTKPGNTGQLPAYIQNIRNAIMRTGKDESSATAIAISRVKRWAAGAGRVGAEVRAAAAKAVKEWMALRGKSKVRKVAEAEAPFALAAVLDALAEELLPDVGDAVQESFGTSGPAADARRRARSKGLTVRRARSGMPPAGSGSWDEGKHKRAGRGARGGGQFIATGSSGWGAKAVQRRLGTAQDGKYGPKTKAAVQAFQQKHGLTVDGVVGRQTALALAGRYELARRTRIGGLRADDKTRLRKLKMPARPSARDRPKRAGGGRVV